MILAGGKGERLYPLTRDRAKPAVPFAGRYRIIDFALSNCINSGLTRIVLLTQYKSISLDRHLRLAWHIFHYEVGGCIYSIPAQHRYGERWYEGTADAIFQNIYTLEQEKPEHVLILSGDHVYAMDYRPFISFHLENRADLTMGAVLYPRKEARRFGVFEVDKEMRVLNFAEKPREPFPFPGKKSHSLVSMGIYIFKTEVLVKRVTEDAKIKESSHDFGKDVIPRMIKEKDRIFTFLFEGYWRDIGTLDAYYEAHQDFLRDPPPIDLHDLSWPIRTYVPPYPPARIKGGEVKNSCISEGCVILGKVYNSFLSPGVFVDEDAVVKDSILLENARVGKGSVVERAILDKEVRVNPGRVVKGKGFVTTEKGVAVYPKGMEV